jgi:hypothetical protein
MTYGSQGRAGGRESSLRADGLVLSSYPLACILSWASLPLHFPFQICIPENSAYDLESTGGGEWGGEGCPVQSIPQMPMESWGGLERIINCH